MSSNVHYQVTLGTYYYKTYNIGIHSPTSPTTSPLCRESAVLEHQEDPRSETCETSRRGWYRTVQESPNHSRRDVQENPRRCGEIRRRGQVFDCGDATGRARPFPVLGHSGPVISVRTDCDYSHRYFFQSFSLFLLLTLVLLWRALRLKDSLLVEMNRRRK